FVEQCEASVKFQAEAKRQDEISGQLGAAVNKRDLSQGGIGEQHLDGRPGDIFVEAHVLLRVELAHQAEKRGYLVLGDLLEKSIRHFRVFYRVILGSFRLPL